MAYDSSKMSKVFLVYSEDKVMVSWDFPNMIIACLSLSSLCTALLELWGGRRPSWEVCTHSLLFLTVIHSVYSLSPLAKSFATSRSRLNIASSLLDPIWAE